MSVLPKRNQAYGAPSNAPSAAIAIDHAHLAALGLTPREREVMQWLSDGKRDREIAAILGLSSRTVEKHVCHIFEKLNVETRTAAASQCRYSIALSTNLMTQPPARAARDSLPSKSTSLPTRPGKGISQNRKPKTESPD